jgi:predicted nucleic acid-binding protein
MIVVDTNIVAYAFIEGEHTEAAREFFSSAGDWAVPPIFEHEIANILVSYGSIKGFSIQSCAALMREIGQFTAGRTLAVDMEQVIACSIQRKLAAYDGQFVWLAESLGGMCLTEDRELRRKCPTIAKSLAQWRRTEGIEQT